MQGIQLPAEVVISTVGAQYKVSVSNDGESFRVIAEEKEQVRDESNKTMLRYRLTEADAATEALYVKFEDSFPKDGWGASFRGGPLTIWHRGLAEEPETVVEVPEKEEQPMTFEPEQNEGESILLVTTPYQEQDREYLVENTAQIADVNDPVNAHRFADGRNFWIYRFDLNGLVLPARLVINTIGAQYEVSVSSDGKDYLVIAQETEPVRDESNKVTLEYQIREEDLGAGQLYVKFTDSFPDDGWGASLRGGPVAIYHSPLQVEAKAVKGFSYYPQFAAPEKLIVVPINKISSAEALLLESVQGHLARQGSPDQIYLLAEGAYEYWLKAIAAQGVTTVQAGDAWAALEQVIGQFQDPKYVLTRLDTDSVNAATSLAGIRGWLIVDESIQARAEEFGLKLALDVRDKDEQWAWQEYKAEFTNALRIQQAESKVNLRDYAIATRAFVFYEKGEPMFKFDVLKSAADDAPILGWGPGGESQHVGLGTMAGMFTVPADWAWNLSVLSAFEARPIVQRLHPGNLGIGDPVHYVTFVMSDGDNVQWLVGDMVSSPKYFANKNRGKFPMGWTISPSLADLAPTAMQWYYDNARQDYFVAGVSGSGYFYPSDYSHLDIHTQRLNDYLSKTDLCIVSILDVVPFTEEDFGSVGEKYAALSNVLGGIYLNYSDYAQGKGKILWVNGKPFVSPRENLWSTDPVALAERINQRPVDPGSEAGYTLVNVHPWSHNLDDVATVVKNLDKDVRVVSPEEFFLQIIYNQGGRFPTLHRPTEVFISEPLNSGRVSKTLTMSGRILSEAPVAYVEVQIDGGQWMRANTTPEGSNWSFEWDSTTVPDGVHVVTVRAWSTEGDVQAKSVTVLVANHSDTAGVTGRVIYGGIPVADALVRLADREAKTDAEGQFSFEYVPADSYVLTVEHPQYPRATKQLNLTAGETLKTQVTIPVVADTRTEWTFADGTQGWKAGVVGDGPPHMGKAFFDNGTGNPAGSLAMDGTDYGNADEKANAWFFNVVRIPEGARTLSFDTRASADTDGELRLVVVPDDGTEHVLFDWEVLQGEVWQKREVDISSFAGQVVTIRFEQRDNDKGIGEYRWVDNVSIK